MIGFLASSLRPKKDYRNMLLIWDIVQVIASHTNMTAVANEFVNRVSTTFKPKCVALISIERKISPAYCHLSALQVA